MKFFFKIGILTTIDNPLLSTYISSLLNENLNELLVICDSKEISKRDRTIWLSRTDGVFPKINSLKNGIYEINDLKIPFYFVKSHNDIENLNLINDLSIDVLLNAGTPRKLSKLILESVKYGVVNIHPGILPRYRGCSAVEWAIYNDEKVGNTAHFMTEGYDEGPIIKSEWYEFPINIDYKSIRIKVYERGCILAGKVLRLIMESKIKPNDIKPQDENNASYWDPIPDDKFNKVLEIIDKRQYYYQRGQ